MIIDFEDVEVSDGPDRIPLSDLTILWNFGEDRGQDGAIYAVRQSDEAKPLTQRSDGACCGDWLQMSRHQRWDAVWRILGQAVIRDGAKLEDARAVVGMIEDDDAAL
ncbi:hypothetical protein [Flavisphingomonas formosensis]|uniref:hypothetical protein n=1 Tax=Flavisphingomonas formosensis TaxID=861534 RepID=UPI0012FBDF91|nr:hypothetical protein [Sphingomonas formosensis]